MLTHVSMYFFADHERTAQCVFGSILFPKKDGGVWGGTPEKIHNFFSFF